jgi:biotin carboxyl carrier protein
VELIALQREIDGVTVLCAPKVGVWRAEVRAGDGLSGRRIGRVTILGRQYAVLAPVGVRGVAAGDIAPGSVAVGYGDALVQVGAAIAAEGAGAVDAGNEGDAAGYKVRSPIDGIYYCRPSPGAPGYVEVGEVIEEGRVVGLVEVMKTFNPVKYGGAGAPARARVVALPAGDQQEIQAGAVLLVVEPV